MHLTPKETAEGVMWPSWKIWVSSCSYSTFCFPSPLVTPSIMCFVANTAESWLRVSSHSVLQSRNDTRGQAEERCVGGPCVSVCRLLTLLSRPSRSYSLSFHRWNDHSIREKRAVWSALIHFCALQWSVSEDNHVQPLPRWRGVSPHRVFVWVSERN